MCSENKGADQLRGYREADLRLCFRVCKKTVFSRRGSIIFTHLNILAVTSFPILKIVSVDFTLPLSVTQLLCTSPLMK